MHLSLLLDMAVDAIGPRVAVTAPGGEVTYAALRERAESMATTLARGPGSRTVYLGLNSLALPVSLFASALAGTAFTPLNYRLTDAELRRIAERAAPGSAIVDADMAKRLDGACGLELIDAGAALERSLATAGADHDPVDQSGEATAVLLFTSGTTGEPKAAVLRHRHLVSYVFSTLDFASAEATEATLISVPPYHIAGIAAVVSSVYTGRRVVYMPSFTPERWIEVAAKEAVTHAMVVPTMLGRILDALDASRTDLPALRHLSYGGGRMPLDVVERALIKWPQVAMVNAYGLTETSSTIAVLGPEDHRAAMASDDPTVRRRLGSVGRPHGEVELSIRDPLGEEVPAGVAGEIWVRGPQVSGEYEGTGNRRPDGWFLTNDGGHVDDDGYLYVEGRLDDVIVRGGENISPGEVEEVLRVHPRVRDAAVIGAPSREWGERIVAVVVPTASEAKPDPEELRGWVGDRLRSTRIPELVVFRDALPYSETGKLLRRILREEVNA